MKNLMKYEISKLNAFKRDLISLEEALHSVGGYIDCMVDMQYMKADRGNMEFERFSNEILEINR